MMRAKLQTAILLTGCLAVASCTPSGDFCDVVRGPIMFDPETAREVVRTDRVAAEAIDVQNRYGSERCGW